MQELKDEFARWTTFTADREEARRYAADPEHTKDLRQQIRDKQAEVQQAQAALQMLKAQLTLSSAEGIGYRKAAFDLEWAQRKSQLKAKVEGLMAEQLEAGVSVPKLMKELQCKSPNWLYSVKENLDLYRGAAKEEMAGAHWEWSDATSVHRYGLAKGPEDNKWAFVLLIGAIESEFEGDKCVFDYGTGNFISGSKALYDSVPQSVKAQRSIMLSEILDGTYTKKVRRETNPYFDAQK